MIMYMIMLCGKSPCDMIALVGAQQERPTYSRAAVGETPSCVPLTLHAWSAVNRHKHTLLQTHNTHVYCMC